MEKTKNEERTGTTAWLFSELAKTTTKELNDALGIISETPWHLVVEFNDKHFPRWRKTPPVSLSNALAGETGEVCSVIKRMEGGGTNNHNHPAPTTEELLEEMADVYIYMILLAEVHGVNQEKFDDAMIAKITKITKRMEERMKEGEGDGLREDRK